jgi:hypothetical protein
MKRSLFSNTGPIVAALYLVIGFIHCRGVESPPFWEDGFLPAPNGKFVASVLHASLELPVPTEGISLRQSIALKIRTMDGKEVLGFTIKSAKEIHQIAYGYVDLAWSPDSRCLAYRNGDDLMVVDVSTKEKKEISRSARSFRWFDASRIIYLANNNSVLRFSLAKGITEELFFSVGGEFHTSTSPYHNQISPDCRLFVFMDGKQVQVADLQKKATIQSVNRPLSPSFCWWNDKSDLCLIHGLEEANTGKAFPEDTALHDIVYLYRRNPGQFEDLTDKLRALNGNFLAIPRPDAPLRVWLADGKSFLVSGGVPRKNRTPDEPIYLDRNWICHLDPWSSVCLQDVLGAQFENPRISTRGDYLTMNKTKREFYRDGDWYLIKSSADIQGKLQLTKPVKVLPPKSGEWFWSADGKNVVTFLHGKLSVQNLPSTH